MWRRVALRIAAVAVVGAVLGLSPEAAGAPPARIAPVAAAVVPAAATYSIARCGNTSGRVLLTFDDWAYGDPYRATRMAAYLKSKGIRAAFFLVNEFASRYPIIVSTLRQRGQWVGNHTWGHKDLTTLSNAGVTWEITHGIAADRLRPPGGAYSSRIIGVASGLGYRLCTWTVDPRDWEYVNGSRRSVASIRSRIRSAPRSAKVSGVILGHLFTNYPDAVPGIIADLRAQGLQFCRNSGPVGRTMPFPLACT
ncbi:MAG: polysaccharide deacetylase family protein [Amnibacterium sp.]